MLRIGYPGLWDELGPEIGPAHFTVLNAPARLAALARDPWADFRAAEAPIEERKTPRRTGGVGGGTGSTAASGREKTDAKRTRGARR